MAKLLTLSFALLLGLGLTAAMFMSSTKPAYACSCVEFSAEEFVDWADAIVIGQIGGKTGILDGVFGGEHRYKFHVERYLKGSGPAQISLKDPIHGASCGYFDDYGTEGSHVVFLSGEGSPYDTNLCAGNSPLDSEYGQERLQEVRSITGAGFTPIGDGPAESSQAVPMIWSALGGVSAIALLVAGILLMLRRRAS